MEENSPGPGVATRDQAGMFQIILNRPPNNSLSLDVVEQLNTIFASILYRNDLKVVVLSASGNTFCSGFAAEDFVKDRSFQLIESYGKLYQHLETLSLPVVSIVQGPAVGAGFELVLYSDFAIAGGNSEIRIS